MGKYGYDFRRVFFRRPIWTPNNVLFGKILTITALMLFTSAAVFATIYRFDKPTTLKPSVRDKLIARIAANAPKDYPPALATSSNDFASIIQGIPFSENLDNNTDFMAPLAEPQKSLRVTNRSGEADITVPDPAPKTLKEAVFTARPIEKAKPAERQTTALDSYRREERNYRQSIRQIKPENEKMTVNKGSFTDFKIVTGYRNDEEALATAMENRDRVQHCIDRIHRLLGNVQGHITVRFEIHPEGYVVPGSVRVVESTIPDPRYAQCFARSIQYWRNFERLDHRMGIYTLTQKYVF